MARLILARAFRLNSSILYPSAITAYTYPVSRTPLHSLTQPTSRLAFQTRSYNYMAPTPWQPNSYPPTRRSDHVDVYKSESKGEVKVPDPYNWLEQNSEETDAWTTTQEKFTRQYLDQYTYRDKLEEEFRVNSDYAKFSAPSLKKDGRWYWSYNSGLQPQAAIYRSKDNKVPNFLNESGPGGDIFFDPNLLVKDGTAAISNTAFSPSGEYFAYAISLSGSDFNTIYVRNTDSPFATAEEGSGPGGSGRLSDEVRYVKFSSISWTHDSKGFFYQRTPTRESHGNAGEDKAGTETDKDANFMLYYHKIGSPQAEDVLVMKDEEHPDYIWASYVTEIDGRYLVLHTSKDTSRKYLLAIADLQTNEIGPNMKWIKVASEFEAAYDILGNDDTKFYIMTNKDAPLYKVVTIDLADPDLKMEDLIPEDPEAPLEKARMVDGGKFVLTYKRNVQDELYLYTLAGKPIERIAPNHVGAIEFGARRDQSFFTATLYGFTSPGTVYFYDFKKEKDKWSLLRDPEVKGINAEDYHVEQVWYSSKDGTKVPMFIVRHKDTPRDGTAPAIQYGYGGFSISIPPIFSATILTFLKRYRAVYAVANIRGGGEFGEKWHQEGILDRKVNVFDDFIAATEYLVKNKIAAPGKVAINGGSNGGLLVAACANRAPEGTFGAAVAEVGVLDFLKFAEFTIGRAWVSDYGVARDPHDFDFMYPLSPLHNIPTNKVLPPTILLTADHDDRVVPLHSFKHAAALQFTLPHNPHPLLIRIEKKAGHGAGKTTQQKIHEAADKWSFVAQSLGLQWHEG